MVESVDLLRVKARRQRDTAAIAQHQREIARLQAELADLDTTERVLTMLQNAGGDDQHLAHAASSSNGSDQTEAELGMGVSLPERFASVAEQEGYAIFPVKEGSQRQSSLPPRPIATRN